MEKAAIKRSSTGMALACLVFAATAAEAALSVRDFGAVGDGVHDDTAALQRAADALNGRERRPDVHCVTNFGPSMIDYPFPALVFPKGTYRVSGPVVFNRNAMLVGEGGATVTNASPDSETFYFRLAHRLIVENLNFAGGRVHVRQWTRNRDVSYLHVSGCRFRGAAGTSVISDSFRDYCGVPEDDGGRKNSSSPCCEPVDVERGGNGLYTLADRDEGKMTPYNNSTLIIVERCAFESNRTALRLYSDGVTVRSCSFTAAEGAVAPQVRAGSGGALGVEMYFRGLRFDYPGKASAPRAAIQFDGGRLLVEKSRFASGGALSAVRSYSNANEYYTASALDLRDVALDCDAAPVVSIKGPWFPNRLSASSVKALRGGRRRLWAFDEEPSEQFMKALPLASKRLRCIPNEHTLAFWHEGVNAAKFDMSLPKPLLPFVRGAPGALRREWGRGDGAEFALGLPSGETFADDTMGRIRRSEAGDDTDKLAALVARAKAAGGGVIELPAKWIRLTRGFSVPGGTLVTCRGRAALDMMDRGKAIFVVPDGADVAFKNIMFVGGGCAIASAAANGRVRAVGCGFYGQAAASIRAESRKPASFAVDVTGGQAYTPALYRGNAKFTMDALWYQMSCAGDREHTPRDHAAIVNLEGGEMRVREMLGVPVYFQWFGKDGVDRDDFVAAHMGDYRWFDNSGLLLSFSNRTGGEYHGLTPIYHHGRATTYVEGGVAEFSLRALRPGRWTVLAADTPDADVTIVDLLSHSHRQPLAVMWSDGGEYRPLSSARMSNTFPFGYRQ